MPEYRFAERGVWERRLGGDVYTKLESELTSNALTKLHGRNWQTAVRNRPYTEHETRYLESHFRGFFYPMEERWKHIEAKELGRRGIRSEDYPTESDITKNLKDFLSKGPLSTSENSNRLTELTKLLVKPPGHMAAWHGPVLRLFLERLYGNRWSSNEEELVSLIKEHLKGGEKKIDPSTVTTKIRRQLARAKPDEKQRWKEIAKIIDLEKQKRNLEKSLENKASKEKLTQREAAALLRQKKEADAKIKALQKKVEEALKKQGAQVTQTVTIRAKEEEKKEEKKEEKESKIIAHPVTVYTPSAPSPGGGAGHGGEEWWMKNIGTWAAIVAIAIIIVLLLTSIFK